MSGISAVALFCEDIRREIGGKETVVGVFADNLSVSSFPTQIRRLLVFFRIRVEVDAKLDDAIIPSLEWNGSPVDVLGPVEPIPLDMLERTIERAKSRNAPFATIAGRVHLSEPVAIDGPGQMVAILKVGEERQVCALLAISQKLSDLPASSSD